MKKIAYILAYIGGICGIVLGILYIVVSYSYYLNQSTTISQRSIIASGSFIFSSAIILVLVHKLDFSKSSSSLILILISIFSMILPGILKYEAKLRYFPEYTKKDFYSIIMSIINSSFEYFPLALVILAGILFLIPSNVKRKF